MKHLPFMVMLFVMFYPNIQMVAEIMDKPDISHGKKGIYLLSVILSVTFACVFLIMLYTGGIR